MVLHYNSGAMTRRTRALRNREPELFVQLNQETARKYGIFDQNMATISTRRGSTSARARVTSQVPEGMLFMPFHFPGTNELTIDALDPTAKIPEYKVAACRIEPASQEEGGK